MPRSKPRKATASPRYEKFRPPTVVVRSNRRATLAGPAQLLSKQSVSPVVVLNASVLGKIKKGSSIAVKSQSKTESSTAAKKTVKKHSPKTAKTVKPSPKPKKLPSPRKSRHTASVKSSPKRSPPKLSPKKLSPKRSSPKQQKSLSPKSSQESPSHSYSLRSLPFLSPKPVHPDKSKTQSTRKTMTTSRKRDRSASPASTKKPKIALSDKKNKSPVVRKSETETPLKAVRKRKRDTISEDNDESKLSPPQKKKQLKSESRSAARKITKKVADVSFTDVKSKEVTGNALKSHGKQISASQQNATPVTAKLSDNWNMSSIKKKLLSGIPVTPNKANKSVVAPASTNARQTKSAFFSAKKIDSTEKRTTRRQSVRFAMNGKADTVKELKQRSFRKRYCYRICQYMLLLGLPAAVTVASYLVYNGLI